MRTNLIHVTGGLSSDGGMRKVEKGEIKKISYKKSINSRGVNMWQLSQYIALTVRGQELSSRQKSEKQRKGNSIPQKWGGR